MADIPFIDTLIEKAIDLSFNNVAIVRNPTPEETYQVKSKSNPQNPHLVKKNGSSITCDSLCAGFATFKLCAHTLAVALKTGDAQGFISRKRPDKPNLLKLATTGLPKGRGRKATKSTLKRKFGRRTKSPQPILESVNNPFFESSFKSVGPCVTSKKRKQQAMSCRQPSSYLNNVRKNIRVPEQPLRDTFSEVMANLRRPLRRKNLTP